MRTLVGASLLAISALSLSLIGCGGSDTSATGVGGDGGSGATGQGAAGPGGAGPGGSGGQACVPSPEICDGLDNNCDGAVDEPPCNCKEGTTQECYSGRPATKGVGECVAGTQTCDGAGKWGPCTGEVVPKAEECNSKDDDCNGMVDDMGTSTCGVGSCQVVVDNCTNGTPNVCTPNMPSLEICDGQDNDCDQQTDESFPNQGKVCDTGMQGVCAPGKSQCLAGAESCVPDLMATNETCDGLDNDCDGTVDNNIPGTGGMCSTGFPGVCSAGTISCQNGSIDCFSITPSSPEICDGLDNDCDGAVDNGDPGSGASCNTGQPGVCGAGTEHCVSGAIACVPNNLGQPEVCNGQDDDCDGVIDDGNPGGNLACGCGGTTACVNGAIACQGGPVSYFSDDFSAGNTKGWLLGPEWTIGAATPTASCAPCPGQDPATDHSATNDNGIAGVSIGTCTGGTVHADYCITSPIINTSAAVNAYLGFWRHLHSDYQPYMTDHVDASSNGGTTWTQVWSNAGAGCINDANWAHQEYNVTAYKSANFRFRICYSIGSTGVYASGSWNVDDVTVTSASCP